MICTIEMFSKTETKVFGIVMLGFVLSCLFLLLLVEGVIRLNQILLDRNRQDRNIHRYYEVDKTEFEIIAQEAIARQKMKSFVMQTQLDRNIEVSVDEILEEVKERTNENDG